MSYLNPNIGHKYSFYSTNKQMTINTHNFVANLTDIFVVNILL